MRCYTIFNGEIKNPEDIELPQSIIESFAHCILPEIREFYNTPEGKRIAKELEEKAE